MGSHKNLNAGNPVSPKVTWPVILLAVSQAVEVAASQDWSQENTYAAILTVVYALVGYFVSDPLRETN